MKTMRLKYHRARYRDTCIGAGHVHCPHCDRAFNASMDYPEYLERHKHITCPYCKKPLGEPSRSAPVRTYKVAPAVSAEKDTKDDPNVIKLYHRDVVIDRIEKFIDELIADYGEILDDDEIRKLIAEKAKV